MSNLEQIADSLSKLTVMEAAELAKMLETKWGVSAAAPMAVAMPGAAAPGAAKAEEKETFDLFLTEAGDDWLSFCSRLEAFRAGETAST